MLPAEGKKQFFKKVSRNCKKELLRACGADERERIARAIHKLKVPVHAFVFAIWLLEAKNAQHSGDSRFFKSPMERKRAEQNGQKSDRSEQSGVNTSFSLRWGIQKVVFLMKNAMG